MNEDQFQEQSRREESLFCRHLTEVYFELPRPSRPDDTDKDADDIELSQREPPDEFCNVQSGIR